MGKCLNTMLAKARGVLRVDWRSQPRTSKAGMEEEAGYMMLWALAPRGAVQKQKAVRSKHTQSQEKNIPPF